VDQVRTSAFLALFDDSVTMDTKIEDLDMDSLEFLDLIQEISSKFGPVPDAVVAKVCTVRELFDAIPA
jgi:acyl carrier protein